jgi:ABC-type phosphate transport system substrate-binding protein
MIERQLLTSQRRRAAFALAVSLAGAMMASAVPARAADFIVIAHPGVPDGSLSREDVRAVFLGDKTTWSDGKPIKIVVLEEGASHKAFLREVLGKTPAQFDTYWKKMVFTGKAAIPKTCGDTQELLDFVARQPGAIGYAGFGATGGSVKTIQVK